MNLPIPCFKSVKKCYYTYDEIADMGTIRFIALDPMAGFKNRYSVIEIDLDSGQAICIGRELEKKIAKQIAKLGIELWGMKQDIKNQ